MADIVGLVASILQLVDAVVKARDYIQNFRNAPKDQQQLLQEIKSLDPLIRQLDERIRSSHAAGLASFETPLNELKEMIERLTKDIVQKSSSRLTWSMWGKEDVQKGLSTIERFKTLLSVWLGADISDSAQVIECAISDLSEEQRVDHRYIITSLNRSARDQQDHHDRTTSTLKSATEEQRINHNYLLKSVRGIARNQEQYLTAEERDRIIEWYSSINFFLRQADILNSRQPGTGQWLLEHHLFKKWKSGVTKTIWCRGMPGAGKTVLVSIVVDNLRAELESETIGIAVIYLSHKETETQSPTNLLAAVWRQLVLGKNLSFDEQLLYARNREQRTRPSLEDTYSVLCSTVSKHVRVFIIVDALDEYPEEKRDILLRHLLKLGPTVNLMLTSRPHIQINHTTAGSHLQTLEIRATEPDIRRHLDAQISQSPRLSRHMKNCPGLRDEIEKTIVKRSDGMFLLAKLHIESLTVKHTVKAVRDALKSLPVDLDSTYGEVLERIHRQGEDDRKLAWRTLAWIMHAKRPLSPSELVEALAIEPETPTLDPDNLLDMETILSVCAGLVIFNNEHNVVRFVHYTIQDYLQRKKAMVFPDAQRDITLACITYLSFWEKMYNRAPPKLYNYYRRPNSFLRYAANYCLVHAQGPPEEHMKDIILWFLSNCSLCWKIWSAELWPGIPKLHPLPLPASETKLWIAAFFDLKEICHHLVEDGADVGRILQEAALSDRTVNVVRILVETTANVPGKDEKYGTALQVAALYGQVQSARLLIESGADVNTAAGPHGTALYAASSQGQSIIVQLLLESGAQVNREGGESGTALQVACWHYAGSNIVTRLLIERGADVNAKGGRYGSPLQAASWLGHEELVKQLIEHNVDINATWDGVYKNALQTAACKGHKAIVRLLIDHGADANAEGVDFALEAAASMGNKGIVGLLLEHGANITSTDGRYSSALQAASSAGSEEIVKMLIKGGVHVNAQGGRYGSALQAASWTGRKAIVRLLIEYGADVNAEHDGSALQAASSEGREGTVRLLIEHGADVNAQTRKYGTPLYAASLRGQHRIVRILIENGAKINGQGGPFGSALRAAFIKNKLDVARLLIDQGADVDERDHEFRVSLLQHVAYYGQCAAVRLLIKHGADVNAEGGALGSALDAARSKGHKDIENLLVRYSTAEILP